MQYTKRMLPFFVIQECNITLDNVLVVYRENPDGKICFEKASWQLGSYDKRTITRHYKRIEEFLTKTIIVIAECASAIPSFASLPAIEPAYDRYQLLESHVQMLDEAVTGMEGETEETEPIVIIAKTYFEQKARKPILCPLNLVSYLIQFHDTS
jgi:hypothetical protein